MVSARTYTLGMPVYLTVHDDGTVTYDVDLSEADQAPAAFEPQYMDMYDPADASIIVTADLVDADTERIRAWLDRRGPGPSRAG